MPEFCLALSAISNCCASRLAFAAYTASTLGRTASLASCLGLLLLIRVPKPKKQLETKSRRKATRVSQMPLPRLAFSFASFPVFAELSLDFAMLKATISKTKARRAKVEARDATQVDMRALENSRKCEMMPKRRERADTPAAIGWIIKA